MSPSDVTVLAGDTLQLNCTATNQPDSPSNLTFDWLRGSIRLFNPSPVTNTIIVDANTVTNQLIIADVSSTDAGSYYCLVHTRTKEDGVRSDTAEVIVNCELITTPTSTTPTLHTTPTLSPPPLQLYPW